jgi:hypothetical protein
VSRLPIGLTLPQVPRWEVVSHMVMVFDHVSDVRAFNLTGFDAVMLTS